MSILLVFVTLIYIFLVGAMIYGWSRIPVFYLKNHPHASGFSIVIPYRNEARNLADLLNSLTKLKYPPSKFEIILVNDASSDNSREICEIFKQNNPQLNIHIPENFRLSESPKKDAITTAIRFANFEYILTTDADCSLPATWLQILNDKIAETSAKLIAGPVKFSPFQYPAKSLRQEKGMKYFGAFQEMDFLSLQAIGAGSFGLDRAFICNGANLCYSRQAFFEVGGFTGNLEVSSGDDVFLLQKFVQKNLTTAFLKSREAIVHTKPQPDLNSLISQRIRWAAKTPAYTSLFARITGLAVLLMNFILVVGFFLAFMEIIPYEPLIIAFLFKFMADLVVLYKSANFFDRKEVLRHYFWSSLVYPFYSTSIAILSLFVKFEWKGREFKK